VDIEYPLGWTRLGITTVCSRLRDEISVADELDEELIELPQHLQQPPSTGHPSKSLNESMLAVVSVASVPDLNRFQFVQHLFDLVSNQVF
jgi:hypothetical protein